MAKNQTKQTLLKECLKYGVYYSNLAKLSDFPDKTLFIKEIFTTNHKKILITAPDKFGKHFRMKLLKTFLEIPRNHKGLVENRENSRNYQFYKDNNLLIYQDQEFFQKHFEQYAVISLNFKYLSAKNFNELIDCFRLVMFDAFQTHSYLLHSTKLDAEEINGLKKYYIRNLVRILTKTDILEGLGFLVECLLKHYVNKKIVVLIESYDSQLIRIMEDRKFDSIRHAYDLYNETLSRILNNKLIEKVVLTGVHYIELSGLSEGADFGKFLFLDDHQFQQYHGLAQTEFDKFLTDFQFDNEARNEFQSFANESNCYVNVNGVKLFNMRVIFCFCSDNFNNCEPERLFEAANIPIIRYTMEKLFLEQPVTIKPSRKFTLDDLIQLRNIFFGNSNSEMMQLENADLFLSFILNVGFLTYDNVINGQVKIINQFVKYYVMRYQINENFNEKYYFTADTRKLSSSHNPDYCLKEYALLFNCITPNSDGKVFKKLIKKLNSNLYRLVFKVQNDYRDFMFDVLLKTDFLIGEKLTFTDGKPDLVYYKDNFCIAIQVTYNKSAKIALQGILEKFGNKFQVDNVMYLGLNVKKNKKVTIRVLVNSTKLSKAKSY